MHFEKSNPQALHCIRDDSGNEEYIEETKTEKELGVVISNDLKWRVHVDRMKGKANRILGMLERTFESRDPELWKEFYVSLVRQHLENAMQAWNPHVQGHIDKIERVQRRVTRIPTVMAKLEYEERLKRLSLTTLKYRRLRSDLIEMYKVMSNRENINLVKPLNLRKHTDIYGPAESFTRKQFKSAQRVF